MLHSAVLAASHRGACPTAGSAWLHPELGFTKAGDGQLAGHGAHPTLPAPQIPPRARNGAKLPCWHQFSGAAGRTDAGKLLPMLLPSALCLVCVDSELFRDETGDFFEVSGTGEPSRNKNARHIRAQFLSAYDLR